MGLFKTNLNKVTGRGTHLFSDATEILLNGAGVRGLTVDGNTESVFFYNINLYDDRSGVVRIESPLSVEIVSIRATQPYVNQFVTLSVYKDPSTLTGTESNTFRSDSICIAHNFDSGSIVYVRKGIKLERIMVVEDIDAIIASVVTTTTTSTSTTSTSSTSTSSTSTSSTSTSSTSTSTTTEEAPGDFYVTSGTATSSTNIRLNILNELALIGTFIAGEWEVLQGGVTVAISSFSVWPNGVNIIVSGLEAGTTITVTYNGSTAESTFGTPLDTFSLLVMTNSVPALSEIELDDGVYYFRIQARACGLNLDQTITGAGFAGTEDIDWGNINTKTLP